MNKGKKQKRMRGMIQRPKSRVGKTRFAQIEARGGRGMRKRDPPQGCLRRGGRGVRLCSSLREEHAQQRPCRSPAITTHYGSRHDPEVSTSLEITGSVSASTSGILPSTLSSYINYHDQEGSLSS